MNSNPYNLQRLRDQTFLREVDFHWEIESTNAYAIQRAEQETVDTPLLVLAEQQTAGRGRGKNLWWSAPGSITFSLIVPVHQVQGDQRPQISLLVGLAVCQAIEQIAPTADLGIKWPNDVYLNRRKLAGALVELPSSHPPLAVLGVGVNANNSFQAAPTEIAKLGVALVDVLETQIDRTDLLIACLQQIERRFRDLETRGRDLIDQVRAYHILQRQVIEVEANQKRYRGVCVGIDDDGALLLETSQGRQRFLAGSITIC